MIDRMADGLVLLWGWRRALAATLAGAVAALALAPIQVYPALWLALPALVLLLDGAVDGDRAGRLVRGRAAFFVGWCFGFGYFLAGLWWIGAAFLVDAERFGWMMPIAVAGLAGGLALFMGLGTWIARLMWSEGWARILALAVGLAVAETLRGHVLTGFPWNAVGYWLAADDRTMQVASLVGLEGMNLLAVLVFAAPVGFLSRRLADRAAAAAGLLLFAALWGFGAWRLAGPGPGEVAGVRLRIMQPAIDQWRKWKPEFRQEIMDRYVELSAGPDGRGMEGVTHLIWPESAFPFLLASEPWALSAIADLLPAGATLLTGAIRAEAPAAGETRARYYNSIYVLRDDAEILAAYDKVHLVPFGEYLPWQQTLEAIGLQQLTHLRGGFTAGASLRTLDVPGAPPVGPLICYEAIFPGAAVAADRRPSWLLNVTNDAWFGLTPGPHQHLQQARLRAVEEGLPLVRAANSGISVVVDALGQTQKLLPLGVANVLNSTLPNALDAPLYARHRAMPIWLIAFSTILLLVLRKIRNIT